MRINYRFPRAKHTKHWLAAHRDGFKVQLWAQKDDDDSCTKKMSFDNALAVAGGFGKFQLWLIFLTIPARANLPLNYLLNNFVAASPSHHCNVDSLDDTDVFRNLSQDEKLRVGIPVREDGKLDSCVMFAEPQYGLLRQNSSNATGLPTVPCQRGWVYDNSIFRDTVVSQVNSTSLIVHECDIRTIQNDACCYSQWDLVCDKRQLKRTSTTVFFIGVMFGAALFGYLSDKYIRRIIIINSTLINFDWKMTNFIFSLSQSFGRKNSLLISYLTAGIFGFISAFSNSFIMFGAMRFFTGMGLSGVAIISVALSWLAV